MRPSNGQTLLAFVALTLVWHVPDTVAQQPSAAGSVAGTPSVLPRPDFHFKGNVGSTYADSDPTRFPQPAQAPKGAPNVVLILIDDAGFGQFSTFGGGVPSPTMDKLAAEGLRFNRFHTTALCSPTRAALITGRNHHSASTGMIMEAATGYDGYTGVIPRSAGTVAEVLRQNGYMTAWIGKNHNLPVWEASAAGPFDHWVNGLGFDYFYGFNAGDMNHWNPVLYENRNLVPASADPNYHLTVDIADHAIAWARKVTSIAPDRPFFLYVAPGATQSPHHAPADWIAKFKGKFDMGWDKHREETFARQKKLGVVPQDAKLTPRAPGLPAWDSLKPDQKRLYARMMEVFAAYGAHCDYHMGRIVDAVKQMPGADNTIFIYIAGDTRNPMIVSWPVRIRDKGDLRTQFTHTIDIVPTLHEVIGITPPEVLNGITQKPVEGISFAYTFDDATAKGRRTTQYFEMGTNRGLYHDGWMASAVSFPPWQAVHEDVNPDQQKWELYDIEKDFSQADNLAARNPGKLRELQDLWWAEAAKYNVLPMDWHVAERFSAELAGRPSLGGDATTLTYYPGQVGLPPEGSPRVLNKSWSITADLEIPAAGAEDIVATHGGITGGYALYLRQGKPTFVYNFLALDRTTVAATEPLPSGKVQLKMEFAYQGGPKELGTPASVTLSANGRKVAEGQVPRTVPSTFGLGEGLDIGEDVGSAVDFTYQPPFRFTGKIDNVVFDLAAQKSGPATAANH